MYSKSTENVCRVCGRATIAGTVECPNCRYVTEKREGRRYMGDLRPVYDNPSHAGAPIGYRIIGGDYSGTVLKAVRK